MVHELGYTPNITLAFRVHVLCKSLACNSAFMVQLPWEAHIYKSSFMVYELWEGNMFMTVLILHAAVS